MLILKGDQNIFICVIICKFPHSENRTYFDMIWFFFGGLGMLKFFHINSR